jgi:scyllo-inositol 2-dehydrogenase (NADP+)
LFHAPLIASVPGLSLVTIVTSDPARRAEARESYPTASVVGSPEAVWDAAAGHDLVVVSTPNSSHLPLGLKALGASSARTPAGRIAQPSGPPQ